jgi:hypothetical protein
LFSECEYAMSDVALNGITTANDRFAARVFGGSLLGFIVGAVAIAAIQLGVAYDYAAEKPRENWGAFLWGEHPIIRVVASVMATVLASWLAGIAGRKAGSVAASLAVLPSIVGWAYCAAASWTGYMSVFGHSAQIQTTTANKAISVLLAVGSLPLAFFVGRAGGTLGERLGPYFDSRRHSLFGIRWYHYLWLPFPLYLLVILNSWAVFYFFSLELASWNTNAFAAIIPGFLSLGLIVSFIVTYDGLARAYRVLSGRETPVRPSSAVLKYGCGYPLLGSVIQTAVNLLHIGLQHIFSWFAK